MMRGTVAGTRAAVSKRSLIVPKEFQSGAMHARLKYGPFEFERRTQTVWRDGSALPALGTRAATLLEALLSRPGEVVTKAELMDTAWKGVAVEEGNLTVQIANLRKA